MQLRSTLSQLAFALVAGVVAASAPSTQALCEHPVYSTPVQPLRLEAGVQHLYAAGGLLPGPGAVRVAAFDGASWSVLPGQFNAQPQALAETASGLVAAGSFTAIDGQPFARIALYTGGAWVALGSGIDAPGEVRAVAEFNGDIYATGSFASAGGAPRANIARFDGVAWQPLGAGLDGPGAALAVHAGKLFVGGAFAHADGQALANAAVWDGVGFAAAASNAVSPVYDFALGANRLYAAAQQVYLLNGGAWQQVGNVATSGVGASMISLVGGTPYVAGAYSGFCQQCVAGARYTNGAWSTFFLEEDWPSLPATSIAGFDGGLYVCGIKYYSPFTPSFYEYSDGIDMNSVQPSFGAWYQPLTLTLNGGCLAPGQPATVRFGGASPLPVTVTSASKASVQIPVGYFENSGWHDLTFEQNGESALLVHAFDVRPSLVTTVITFLLNQVELKVNATTPGGGSAWFLWSPSLASQPLPIGGVHGLLALQADQTTLFGGGALAANPTLIVPYAPSQVPDGATFFVQAAAVEFAVGGPYWSLTNATVVTIP